MQMKRESGISVLALTITVIVMLIITSITTYNGVTLIKESRKKDATDKLSVICNSLRKDDTFLDFSLGDVVLTEQIYMALDLREYYDEDYPVVVQKIFTTEPEREITHYVLTMYDGADLTEQYATQSFTIERALEKNTYEISFDETKNVNRPIILDGMYAMKSDLSGVVEDIYIDTWYNYNPSAPSFAKMKYDSDGDGSIEDESHIFVWIPRFAYSIQDYYDGYDNPLKQFREVPSSVMKIVFLRDDTKYMSNNEVLPSSYQVHPAFRAGGKDHAGIWVAMNTSNSSGNFSKAITETRALVGENSNISSHLMTNSEFSAALYLMFAYKCFDEIDFKTQNEYVAAGNESNSILSNLEYADLYEKDTGSETGVSIRRGDAMVETNWDRYTSVFPEVDGSIVVRLLKSSYFDFQSVDDSMQYYYRPVIVIE